MNERLEGIGGKKMESVKNKIRYPLLDVIRGTVLINAIAYHCVWDLVYMFGVDWRWYQTGGAYLWQQMICWTFILLSGFCWSLGRRRLKRGTTVFGAGLIVMAVTEVFLPDSRVVFGVLTLIGSGMLLWVVLEPALRRVPAVVGVLAITALFLITRNVNEGYLGFEGWNLCRVPEGWYRNLLTAYLGFPPRGFYYFSLFPWIFLFGAGYFLYRLAEEKQKMEVFSRPRQPLLEFLGRHSLVIYLLHQPVIYGILLVVFL